MSEYIIEWFGIGEQLTRLREGNVPLVLWPKLIREERRREEIVRCRDCKWCMAYMSGTYCDYMAHAVELDGFCKWGERK